MASLENDMSYRELRKEVSDKAFNVMLVGLGVTAATFALGGLAFLASPVAGILVGGAIGMAGAVATFRMQHDLQLDYEELDAMRRADHLERVVEKTNGRVNPIVL
jgi:hypothetical protein